MSAKNGTLAPDHLLAGPYRRPFRRSLTLDFLGQTFSDQAQLAEAAAAAGAAAKQQHEREVEDHFADAVTSRGRSRWTWVGGALVSAGSALAYLLT